MKELVVLSGKGGTGKTSVTASLAARIPGLVIADADVDASDLPLVLKPRRVRRERFVSGVRARIETERCTGCGTCVALCRFAAVTLGPDPATGQSRAKIEPAACEGCGVCERFCPAGAIRLDPAERGEWFVSETRRGPMVHARLIPGEQNSGKLVSRVRREARSLAEQHRAAGLLTDGPPGTGCPVIAALGGADHVLVVTEPSVSGLSDFTRLAEVVAHFRIPASLAVNRWDIDEEMTARIEDAARARGIEVIGRLRYDPAVTAAQRAGRAVVEDARAGIGEDLRNITTALVDRGVLPGGRAVRESPERERQG